MVYTVPDAAGVLGSQCAALGVESGGQLRLGLGRLDFSHRVKHLLPSTKQLFNGILLLVDTCGSWADDS